MNIVASFLVLVGSTLMSDDLFTEKCDFEEDKPICWVNEVRNKILEKYSKKYGLIVTGILDGMPERVINEVGVYFCIYQVISKEKARQIVVECAQDFIKELNEYPQLKPYYKSYPLSPKNIDVSLFMHHPDGKSTSYPDLCVVSASLGSVAFKTNDPENVNKYKTREYETFEEAVALVNKQK